MSSGFPPYPVRQVPGRNVPATIRFSTHGYCPRSNVRYTERRAPGTILRSVGKNLLPQAGTPDPYMHNGHLPSFLHRHPAPTARQAVPQNPSQFFFQTYFQFPAPRIVHGRRTSQSVVVIVKMSVSELRLIREKIPRSSFRNSSL